MIHPLSGDILVHGLARLFLEKTGQVGRIISRYFGYLRQGQIIPNIGFDVILNKAYRHMGGNVPVVGNQPHAGNKPIFLQGFRDAFVKLRKPADSIDHAAHINRAFLAAGSIINGLNTFH